MFNVVFEANLVYTVVPDAYSMCTVVSDACSMLTVGSDGYSMFNVVSDTFHHRLTRTPYVECFLFFVIRIFKTREADR